MSNEAQIPQDIQDDAYYHSRSKHIERNIIKIAEDSYIAGAIAERNRNNWIDVKEKMPSFDTRVLICRNGEVDSAYIDGYYKKWMYDAMSFIQSDAVTHWSILPSPPQQK